MFTVFEVTYPEVVAERVVLDETYEQEKTELDSKSMF
jgi:hypothetical protein